MTPIRKVVTVKKIFHNEKRKDGTPYISKKGKPYSRCVIFIAGKDGEDVRLSGFGNHVTAQVRPGDKVSLEMSKDEQWGWQFKGEVHLIEQAGAVDVESEVKNAFAAQASVSEAKELTADEIPF